MEYHHLLLQTNCIWRFELKLAALILACTFLAAVAHAETLRGTVSERTSGARVPGAAIRVSSNAFEASATTDSEGNFKIDVPSAGAYRVSVEQPGFRPYLQPDVQVAGP